MCTLWFINEMMFVWFRDDWVLFIEDRLLGDWRDILWHSWLPWSNERVLEHNVKLIVFDRWTLIYRNRIKLQLFWRTHLGRQTTVFNVLVEVSAPDRYLVVWDSYRLVSTIWFILDVNMRNWIFLWAGQRIVIETFL
jgi:hypothetical protein